MVYKLSKTTIDHLIYINGFENYWCAKSSIPIVSVLGVMKLLKNYIFLSR